MGLTNVLQSYFWEALSENLGLPYAFPNQKASHNPPRKHNNFSINEAKKGMRLPGDSTFSSAKTSTPRASDKFFFNYPRHVHEERVRMNQASKLIVKIRTCVLSWATDCGTFGDVATFCRCRGSGCLSYPWVGAPSSAASSPLKRPLITFNI